MPLTYTGAPNIIDKLMRVYRGAVPADVASQNRALDEARVFAEMVALAEGEGAGWAREARLSTSHGLWTDQHARDRGLGRGGGESDTTLIARLKSGPKAVTYDPIYQAILGIIRASSATAIFYLIRIPVDLGAFSDADCWCDADSRVTPTHMRVTVALIPASLGLRKAVLDAMRSKMPVGHAYNVEEF